MPRVVITFLTVTVFFSLGFNSVLAENTGTVLITGANRGIGLAIAEKFSESGYLVIGTARKPDAAKELRQLPVRILQLDVTNPASVALLASSLDGEAIDILINNAGMLSVEASEFADVDIDALVTEYRVNALGALRVTQALLPNVLAGKQKVVANISSMMGSQELNTFGCCLGYRASKAALNSFTKTLAVDLAETDIAFVAIHPGYVKTDMNGGQGAITSEQSAAGLFKVISALSKADSGKFYNYDGASMPW